MHAYACPAAGGVTHLAPSGALDVVAVARASGAVQLLDARRDVVLCELDHGSAVSCCCFCRGAGRRRFPDARREETTAGPQQPAQPDRPRL